MRRNNRPNFYLMFVALLACARADLRAQAKPEMKAEDARLRVALAGLVHGHSFGFFDQFQHRTDLQVVGIAEADHQLTEQFAKRYGLPRGILFSELEEMLKKTHPQAWMAITKKFSHLTMMAI